MADNPTVCPFCNDTILIPEEFYGSEVECPTCHKQFFIPKITEEEDSADGMDGGKGTFDCPSCGMQNIIPDNFSGKLKCQGCQKEIEVINEKMMPCPHCGKIISKDDTTCIFCQRSPSEPPQKQNKARSKQNNVNPSAKTSKFPALKSQDFMNDGADQVDLYVLKTLKLSKRLSMITFIVIAVVCGCCMVMAAISKQMVVLAGAFFVLATVGLLCCAWHFTISYREGIYRNIMRTRIATEKMSGTRK